MKSLVDTWSSSRVKIGAARARVTHALPGIWRAKEWAAHMRSWNCAAQSLQRLRQIKREHAQQGLIGILLYEHFGDTVAAEPVARFVRSQHPDDYLVWFTNPGYVQLLKAHPSIDLVFPIQSITEAGKIIRSGVLDHVVDLHLEGKPCTKYNLLHRKANGVRAITTENYFDHGTLLEAFSASAGLPKLSEQPELHLPVEAMLRFETLNLPPNYVVVHALSNEAVRNWTNEGWRTLAEAVVRSGRTVVEICLIPVLKDVAGVINLCGKLSLAETAAVVSRSPAFIGVDSGPGHFANAFQRPSVILLGKYRRFERYMPYTGFLRDRANQMLIQWPTPCANIPVAEVIGRLTQLGIV